MTEMKQRTPVDKNVLRSSGDVQSPTFDGNLIRVMLTFGGAASEYALEVHEDLEAFHRVGQAKFMESVLNESAGSMRVRVGRRIDFNRLIR